MGFRLVILAAMGLGALYMVHLLAQDYNKIQKPAARLAKFLFNKSKRDINTVAPPPINENLNFTINWTNIMQNDPLKCAQSLICQIVAGSESQNPETANILALVGYSLIHNAPNDIRKAHANGLTNNKRPHRCYKRYPICPYSAKTMLNILQIHATIFT